jgi:hypothetical protein
MPTTFSLDTLKVKCADWLAHAERDPDAVPAIVDELNKFLSSLGPEDMAARLFLRRLRTQLDTLRGTRPAPARRRQAHG